MKTKFRNIKRLLSMAALALVGTMISSCTSDDLTIEAPQPETNGTVTLTTTISFDGGAQTRALTASGVKTFAENDQIAVFYKSTDNNWVKKAVSVALTDANISADGKTATFTVTLENPKANGDLRYVYPAAMAEAPPYLEETNSDETVNYSALKAQDGSLTSLAKDLDLAIFDGKLTADAKLPATASLTNPLVIGEFTIKNGGSDINNSLTMLNVSVGDKYYTIKPKSPATTFGSDPIYVAMHPVTSGNINFFATDGTTNYHKIATIDAEHKLIAGNMQPVNLTMNTQSAADVLLEALTGDYTATNGQILSGTLLGGYKISIADGATVTLNGVNINANGYLGGGFTSEFAGITCLGDATIVLADGSVNTVICFTGGESGIFVPEGKTLTIQGGTAGTGALYAEGGGDSAGIGSGPGGKCGNITISGGAVTAIGRENAAGIGSGFFGSCGNITISGGAVTATGDNGGAGIGSGFSGSCDNITISKPATGTATRGSHSPNDIGAGLNGTCGTVSVEKGSITGFTLELTLYSCTFTLNYCLNMGVPVYHVNEDANHQLNNITIIVNVGGKNYSVTGKYTDGSSVTIDLPETNNATLTVTSADTNYKNEYDYSGTVMIHTANFVGTLENVTISAAPTNLGTVVLIKQN